MSVWLKFFIGTPQRFLGTLAGFAVLAVMISPGLLQNVLGRVVSEVGPLMGPLFAIAVMFLGIRHIVFGGRR